MLFAVLLALTLLLWRAENSIGQGANGGSPDVVLWGGLTLATVMSAAIYQTLHSRACIQEQTQKHLEAIESLNDISTAISAQITSSTVLEQLAEAARRLLGMDRAGVCLVDESRGTLEVIAASGDMPANFPRLFDLKHLPACSHCLKTGLLIMERNVNNVEGPFDLKTLRIFGVVAIALIPLYVEKRPIGLLTLSSSHPRDFTDLDRRIGELLGSQASVILFNAQLYDRMRSALESRTHLLRQREALAAANVAIRSSDTVEASLQKITELVPAALGADLCALTLLTGNGEDSVLIALNRPLEKHVGAIPGPNLLAREAFQTGKPLNVPDARADSRLHSAWRCLPDVGSLLYVPMFRGDGRPLGILALVRNQTGPFSQEQIELGQTFAALSAVAVENARLLEQTRVDAATKTDLLRELNHRVKNNLSGIVALLGMDAPVMPPEVRLWLQRVTDRIRTMAGAHQLFTGQMERVSLQALVAQTLETLAVSKPPGVAITTDLDGVRLALSTEQAVGLAMVLHELCYNAMVHGLCKGGTLSIGARGLSPAEDGQADGSAAGTRSSNILIEVADDGPGCCDANSQSAENCAPRVIANHPTGTGQGLQLVEGLVRRELRGKFTLSTKPGGGTVATIVFPCLQENARAVL